MLRNYIRTAVRNFSRERAFALINLIGLTLGLACALVLTTFLRQELSYDRFHENADRIYRVISEDSLGGDLMRNANVIALAAPRFQERIPQIDATVRMHREQVVLAAGDQLFAEQEFFWSDPNVFEVFDFPLAVGDPGSALTRPGTAVLTRDMAVKLFGDRPPLGQVVRIDSKYDLEVTGILADIPLASHLHPAMMGSFPTLGDASNPWSPEFQGWSYVELVPGARAADVERLMDGSLEDVVTWLNLDALFWRYRLQPLKDVRLHSAGITSTGDVGDIRYVYLFAVITVLIVLTACVNFTNLATARSLKRLREVGMRKTLGASRRQIALQFLGESTGLAIFAAAGAALLVTLAQSYIATVFGRPVRVDFVTDPALLVWLLGLTILTGLAAGFVPAVFLSRFDPIRSLRGMSAGRMRSLFRRSLVVGQFAVSVGLVFMSLVIGAQMRYIQRKNLGFRTDNVVSIRTTGLGDRDAFKRAVLEIPGVVSASYAGGFPLGGGMLSDSEYEGRKVSTIRMPADADYLATMGLKLAAGRYYDRDRPDDAESSLVVSESYARFRGWDDPLSERVVNGMGEDGSPKMVDVIGVVKDFHTGTMHSKIIPVIFDARNAMGMFRFALVVRLAANDPAGTLSSLEEKWNEFVPDRPFSSQYGDDYVRAKYETEDRLGSLFGFFTWLSVGIAGLGLFGLAAYSAERRTKEVGIRKVLGAGVGRIALLLMKEYVGLVAVSVAVGLPLAYIGAGRWLDGFAYRIAITPTVFLVTAAGVLSFAVFAVLTQALRGATADPVKSLRHE